MLSLSLLVNKDYYRNHILGDLNKYAVHMLDKYFTPTRIQLQLFADLFSTNIYIYHDVNEDQIYESFTHKN
jgi:hypothetical protein